MKRALAHWKLLGAQVRKQFQLYHSYWALFESEVFIVMKC